MSRETEPIQMPLTQQEKRRRQIRRTKANSEYKRSQVFENWWRESMYNLFRQGALIWINNQGAQMARRANINVEDTGIEMALIDTQSDMTNAFGKAKGKPINSQEIVNKIVREARIIETARGFQPGWSKNYLDWCIDTLGDSWELTEKTVGSLKSSSSAIYQRELPGFQTSLSPNRP